MIEENQASLLQARDNLEQLKKTREEQAPSEEETADPTESEPMTSSSLFFYIRFSHRNPD